MKIITILDDYKSKNLSLNKLIIAIQVLLLSPNLLNAQERIVDDAAITTYRSFQIETWYAEYESAFIPAVSWNNWLETSVGLFFDTKNAFDFDQLMLEVKVISADYEEKGHAFALVVGTMIDKSAKLNELYAFVPYSRLFMGSNVLHLNAGVTTYNFDSNMKAAVTYGARADWEIHDRVDILTGLFAENTTFGFYSGLRIQLIKDKLALIPTYGRGFLRGLKEPGFSIQLSITPDTLW